MPIAGHLWVPVINPSTVKCLDYTVQHLKNPSQSWPAAPASTWARPMGRQSPLAHKGWGQHLARKRPLPHCSGGDPVDAVLHQWVKPGQSTVPSLCSFCLLSLDLKITHSLMQRWDILFFTAKGGVCNGIQSSRGTVSKKSRRGNGTKRYSPQNGRRYRPDL